MKGVFERAIAFTPTDPVALCSKIAVDRHRDPIMKALTGQKLCENPCDRLEKIGQNKLQFIS